MIFLLQAIVSVLAILVSTFLVYRWYLRRNHFWVGKPIPSDPPTPLFGILFHAMLGKAFQDIDTELYNKYGRIFGAYNGTQPCIFVAEGELLRSILVKDFHIFATRRELVTGNPIMDSMVSILKGDSQWRNIRNTMTPAFSTGKIKNMLPIMSECAKLSVNNFDKYSKQNQIVDIKRLYGSYTLDIIANVAFGTKLDSHNDPDNEFVTHARKVFSRDLSLSTLIGFAFPKWGKLVGLEFFPSSTMEFFESVVNTIAERRLKNKEVRHDFLQIMIDSMQAGEAEKTDTTEDRASDSPVQSVDQIKRKPLNKNEFLGQCILFFLAGYDTTATTLTLATYYLAMNPEAKEKALKEVDRIWSKTETLDAETMHEAKYIDAVIDETLRLSPPATRVERSASEDYPLGDTGITVPKGMVIEIPVYAMHHDKDYFPDPEQFRPERFLKGEEDNVQPYSYIPFGAGPRNCIAMRLALTEAKLCLLHVLRRFDFTPCEKTMIPLQFSQGAGLLSPKDMFLTVTERSA